MTEVMIARVQLAHLYCHGASRHWLVAHDGDAPRIPIHSALWLIVTFFSIAILYLTLNAQFIAVAQVMVYAGAIMMLIIFVIMLIHLEDGAGAGGKGSRAQRSSVRSSRSSFSSRSLAAILSFKVTGQERARLRPRPSPSSAT